MGDISQANSALTEEKGAVTKKLTFNAGLVEVNFEMDQNYKEGLKQGRETNTLSNPKE